MKEHALKPSNSVEHNLDHLKLNDELRLKNLHLDSIKNVETLKNKKKEHDKQFKHKSNCEDVFHLKLKLDEKQNEIDTLKKLLRSEEFQKKKNIRPSSSVKFSMYDSLQESESINQPKIDKYSRLNVSPYNGSRTGSLKTESSVVTTNVSQIRKNHNFFKNIIIPFIQNIINCFQSSYIFKDEANNLNLKFNEILELNFDDDHKIDLLSELLDNITYLQIQQISFLNKELQVKKISNELDYLYNNVSFNKQSSLSTGKLHEFKKQSLDVMGRYFDNQEYNYLPQDSSDNNPNKQNHYYLKSFSRNDMYEYGKPLEINYRSKELLDDPQLKYKVPKYENASVLSPQNLNSNKLDFIPIGYTEKHLRNKLLTRRYPLNEENMISPVNLTENVEEESPLRKFLKEQK